MNIRNLFNLLLISILTISISSCDSDDEPIEGSWLYRGVHRVEARTNHQSLTRAIELDAVEYARDFEHALIFDGERMMKMYGYELEYSVDYTYRWGELTLHFNRYDQTIDFDINGSSALMRESYFGDYAYEDGYIREDMIYYLMNEYPFLRNDLRGVDLRTLYVDRVDVFKKYGKVD